MDTVNRMTALRDWIRSRSRSDEADAVLVSVVLAVPLIVLMMGWGIDFSKNVMIRGEYDNIAQTSANTAIHYQDGIGDVECVSTEWLNWTQAVSFVNSNMDGKGAGSAAAVATYMMKTGRADTGTFTSNQIKNVYAGDTDYMKVMTLRSFAQTMSAGSRYRSTMGDSTTQGDPNYFAIKVTCSNTDSGGDHNRGTGSDSNVNNVRLQVQDWTSNLFLNLPTYNNGTPTGGMTQVQKFNIDKYAISSYSQSSLNH